MDTSAIYRRPLSSNEPTTNNPQPTTHEGFFWKESLRDRSHRLQGILALRVVARDGGDRPWVCTVTGYKALSL